MPNDLPAPVPVYLKDYTPPPFWIDTVVLDVDIQPQATYVKATLSGRRNTSVRGGHDLLLDGEALETVSLTLNGKLLAPDAYELNATQLRLKDVPASFTLESVVRIDPTQNTQLAGLYRSRDGYFTQCEPQGFRRITWFLDRPDVMARYTVTLHADKADFPVLLSNGNPLSTVDEPGGRHAATWEDPFPKPSYLFALVAGKLDVLRDHYRTASGREVQLAIYVEPGKLDQCPHAMAALKKSMRWDEERFGLECDLAHYMIVAVSDFNMGAMENKGLNIFNTKYVLARSDVATDADFENIDRVVAHEYFHNWTGNRVTCRDWFQLSLKEGLTVFRDQEFGADTHSAEVARLREVRNLRAVQFPEDSGPMGHSVRPASYLEINNFYTATVYEKGAELVRMIQTLIGKETFRQGMALYFADHDGKAVTCDDFVESMSDASGLDFKPFMTWYSQAGTPHVSVKTHYDADAQRYTVTLAQHTAPTPGQPEKAPYLIPFAVGLLGPDGQDMDLGKGTGVAEFTRLLPLRQSEESFVFEKIPYAPVPSLLRNFSAPVVLEWAASQAELVHLLTYDSDPFNRWEAGQKLFAVLICQAANPDASEADKTPKNFPALLAAVRQVLLGQGDPAFIAEALSLPSEATLAEQLPRVDPEALFLARTNLARLLAQGLEGDFSKLYARLAPSGAYQPTTREVARRRLRNLCLAYLNELDSAQYRALAWQQFQDADNMTDQFAALNTLVNAPGDAGDQALAAFYQRWQHEALVVDKWLAVQAASRLPGTLARVEALTRHPAFDLTNPNKVYALLRTFGGNHRHFHAADGHAYAFLAEQIAVLDPKNPQIAARLARCFDHWKRFDETRQSHARAALESLQQRSGLSRDVFEVVGKALA